jgi:hypothetical protein
MEYKNRYSCRARINENTVRKLVRHYADGLDASSIAIKLELNRNTANRYIQEIRQLLSCRLPEFRTSIRGRDPLLSTIGCGYLTKYKNTSLSHTKTLVLGAQLQGGSVHLCIIKGHYLDLTLRGIIRGSIPREHVLDWRDLASFDALIDVGQKTAYPLDSSNDIGIIEEFWSLTKAGLAMYRGIKPELLELYLNEYLFRFNHRNQDIYSLLMERLKQKPLFSQGRKVSSWRPKTLKS